jgi:tetratricopeptide (TPR) repeat protein
MEARKKQTEKKQQTATALKLKGNRFFKAKKYDEALGQYMDALKSSPYEGTAILTNIAQAHIQLQNYEAALEFLNRALYLQPNCVKVYP